MPNGNQVDRGDLWKVVEALQREAGGCNKMVTISLFFDRAGRLRGRSEPKVVKLLPGNIMEMIEQMMG